jgi:3-isopropylmalate/(R)-2-methylmalate dehydratase small subunit
MEQPLTAHRGRAVALRRDDIDTDQIIPAAYCRRLTKTGYAPALFATWRDDPEFVLNDERHAGATVLVAGANFGTGSSREHAVWALHDYGFRVVVASSFGDIFARNALRNGLLAIALPKVAVTVLHDLADAGAGAEIVVDLAASTVTAGRDSWPFQIDERARQMLLAGQDDIDVTLTAVAAIDAYEAGRACWLPVVAPAPVPAPVTVGL